MKYCIILMVFLMLTGLSSPQIDTVFSVYAGGGVSFAGDDLKTTWKNGLHGMAAFGYLLTPGMEGGLPYAYHAFPSKIDTTIVPNIADTKDDFDVHEFSVDFRANLAVPGYRFRPYGLIGVGLAKTPRENKLFYCAGGGFKMIIMPRLSWFIEGRYTRVTFDSFDVSHVPVTLGIVVGL